MITKSKSLCFEKLAEKIDDILVKLHARSVSNEPLGYNCDEWINARDRLMSIKVGGNNLGTFPINFQLADHLILSELGSRTPPIKEHLDEYYAKMGGSN